MRKSRIKAVRAADHELRPKFRKVKLPVKKRPKQSAPVAGRRIPHRVADAIKPEKIERLYEGKTAVLFATGPDLTQDVVDQVMRARHDQELYLFGCNDSYKVAPFLHVHYACDFQWWREHYKRMSDFEAVNGLWTQEPSMSTAQFPRLHRIAGRSSSGLSTAQDLIHFGNNSGYQLINLALLFGIKRFILCGYNMQPVKGVRHFFGDHPQGMSRGGNYTGFIGNYKTIKPEKYGIEIINATPNTALNCFPKMTLTEALK